MTTTPQPAATVVLKRAYRAVWLKHRMTGLGGSDIGAVLGLSPWRTPLDVWLDKTGRTPPNDGDSYAMRRGTHLEAFLIAEYGRQHPDAILERPPALLRHPTVPILLASLDHLAHHPTDTRLLEAKTAGWRQRGDWWDDTLLIPDGYAVQVLAYLAVTGLDRCDVIADIAGDFTEVVIHRDPVWEDEVLPYLADWWERHVVADTPPPITVDRDSIPALNRVWVPDPGEAVEADAVTVAAVMVARSARDTRAAAEGRYEVERVRIRAAMRTASRLLHPDTGELLARVDKRGTLTIPTPKETA